MIPKTVINIDNEDEAFAVINGMAITEASKNTYRSQWRTKRYDERQKQIEREQRRKEKADDERQRGRPIVTLPNDDSIYDPDYCGGKIYRIVSSTGQYIGSTKSIMNQRLAKHIWDLQHSPENNNAVFDILRGEEPRILLLEHYPCRNRTELREREQFWIDLLPCVNKKTACTAKRHSILARYYRREKVKKSKGN